ARDRSIPWRRTSPTRSRARPACASATLRSRPSGSGARSKSRKRNKFMMPLRRFTIDQPKTAKEAAEMLAHYGENGRLYAGGTELLLAMKHDLLRYEHLVDVKTIADLSRVSVSKNVFRIGATVTHRAVERSPEVREHCPVLVDMEHNVANVRVRATGTLGGNLCFAEPHSDPATLLLALEAHVHIAGKNREPTPHPPHPLPPPSYTPL